MQILHASKLRRIGGLFVLIPLIAANASPQQQTDQQRAEQEALRSLRSRGDLPEASLPCTPQEAKWWNDVRAASKEIGRTRAAKKQKGELNRLIKEGLEKSYQIPIPDQSAAHLWQSTPDYTEEFLHKRVNGSVAMAVELRHDGTVGEVRIVQGLDRVVNETAVNWARKLVFLPAVKDRKFVTSWIPMPMRFFH